MGIENRHYNQMPTGNMPPQPSRLAGSPVVKWLMIINIAIFLIDILLKGNEAAYGPLWRSGYFSISTVFESGQLWRLMSFQFLHADMGHLFFNMFALYMFGSFVEQWWGSRKFLGYYLLCGASGALFYTVLYQVGIFGKDPINFGGYLVPSTVIPLVGASAGIYACLIAVAIIAPNLEVRLLFPPIPMKMKTFAKGILAIAVIVTFMNWSNAGGEAGHLGGAILGYFLMKNPRLLSWIDRLPSWGGAHRSSGGHRVVDAQVMNEPKLRPRTRVQLGDSEVDAILDKVNREGIQSLTDEERETLRRSSGN